MNIKKWLTIGLALGVVANAMDAVVQVNLLASYYAAPPFRQDTTLVWLVVGDFVSALVFTWVYLTFAPAAGRGVAGGAKLGLYAGVLVSFPANIFLHLLVRALVDLDRLWHRLVRRARHNRGRDEQTLRTIGESR